MQLTPKYFSFVSLSILFLPYAAIFASGRASDGLKQVQVRVDTDVLIKAMVDQARIVVLKAVATATDTTVRDFPKMASQNDTEKEKAVVAASTTESLGSFRHAMTLSRSEADPRLQKARTSALRLNRVLHGKRTNNLPSSMAGMRKARSSAVKWDHPGQTPRLNATLAPTPKMMESSASKLKSFKSFGRPHAGDFGSGPRNATFGAFGRSPVGVWGRDGRLAHHPAPMIMEAAVDEMGNMKGGSVDKNATFDKISTTGRPPSSAAAASGAALLLGRTSSLSSSSSSSMMMSGGRASSSMVASTSAASMPRTATALENTLMKKWSS